MKSTVARFFHAGLRHRLTHFFMVGSILFAIAPPPEHTRTIRLEPDVVATLRAAEAQKLGIHSLSPEDMRRVEARAVEDELLYREALRLRIAEGDIIVRQRLVQKLLVLAEDIDGASRPLTDTELRDCFAKTPNKWKMPAEVRFIHVHGASREQVAALREQATAFSAEAGHDLEVPPLGDSFPTNRRVIAPIEDIGHAYGSEFAAALKGFPVRTWSDPIASKYGWHIVRVLTYSPEKPATLDDVRIEVALDCQVRRREEAVRRYVGRLFTEYDVYVGGERIRDFSPTDRIAPRGELSGED